MVSGAGGIAYDSSSRTRRMRNTIPDLSRRTNEGRVALDLAAVKEGFERRDVESGRLLDKTYDATEIVDRDAPPATRPPDRPLDPLAMGGRRLSLCFSLFPLGFFLLFYLHVLGSWKFLA